MTAYKKSLVRMLAAISLTLQAIALFAFLRSGVPAWLAVWASFLGWIPVGVPVLVYWNDEEHRYL